MQDNDFKTLLKSIDVYDKSEYNTVIMSAKHNICQNMRIARKLSNIEPELAAQYLDLEPQSLRRIEAENDRDEFSIKVFIMVFLSIKFLLSNSKCHNKSITHLPVNATYLFFDLV